MIGAQDLRDTRNKPFAILSQEVQKYVSMLLLDIQRGNKKVEDGKSLSDYITEYQVEARNDSIHRFAVAIGVDEAQLRSFMDLGVNKDNINEFGLFDRLKDPTQLGSSSRSLPTRALPGRIQRSATGLTR